MQYHKRLEKLQSELAKQQADALIVDNPIDLFYLCGLELSLGRLLVTSQQASLFVDGRYLEDCQENCPFTVLDSKDKAFYQYIEAQKIQSLAFDSAFNSHENYLELQKQLKCTLKTWPQPLKNLRVQKDPEEIAILREAAELGSKGFDLGLSLLKEGVSEEEIARKIEIFWKEQGAISPSFDINVSFGKNSSKPHHRASSQKLEKGQIVLFDIGVNYRHYASDMTRTLFFGPPQAKLAEIYEVVLEAQEKSLALCKQGTRLKELDQASRGHIQKKGFGQYYPHSLGHGIGLEVHEFPGIREEHPDSENTLVEGMVFTVEPGIYLPGLGGVRIEDSVCVLGTGHENFSQRSKELLVIEGNN